LRGALRKIVRFRFCEGGLRDEILEPIILTINSDENSGSGNDNDG